MPIKLFRKLQHVYAQKHIIRLHMQVFLHPEWLIANPVTQIQVRWVSNYSKRGCGQEFRNTKIMSLRPRSALPTPNTF